MRLVKGGTKDYFKGLRVRRSHGFSLMELLIALSLSAVLFLVIDKVMASLWVTRKLLEQSQQKEYLRAMPQQLFADLIFHAGHLGCRSVKDNMDIKTPAQHPDIFFIQDGEALRILGDELWVHETRSHQLTEFMPIPEGEIIKPQGFKEKSDWLLISDCEHAELLPYGGRTTQAYEPPITLIPMMVYRWTVKNQNITRQQVYPNSPSQPVLGSVDTWIWEGSGNLLILRWRSSDAWEKLVFERGNS